MEEGTGLGTRTCFEYCKLLMLTESNSPTCPIGCDAELVKKRTTNSSDEHLRGKRSARARSQSEKSENAQYFIEDDGKSKLSRG